MTQMSQSSQMPQSGQASGQTHGQSSHGGQMSQDSMSGTIGERLADVGGKAATLADEATRKVGNAASSLAEGAEAVTSDVGARLKTVGHEAEAMASAAREKAGDLEAMIAAEVKAHPIRTLAMAAVAGAVLGFFAGR